MRILRGVSSHVLDCGCIAGVYETYAGDIVTIIDSRATACAEPAHARGNIVPADNREFDRRPPDAFF